MCYIAGLLIATVTLVPDDLLSYRVPESASLEETTKAALALAARSRSYGYKGVRTAVVERGGRKFIQVACEGGLTPEMKAVLNAFGRMSGSSVELRFPAVQNDVKKEKRDPPRLRSSVDKGAAGTTWLRFRDSDQAPVLFCDEPVVNRGEIQMRTIKDKSGSPRVFWDISQLRSREIRDAEGKAWVGSPYLVMDGWLIESVALNTLERNEEGQIVPAARLYFTPSSRITLEALIYPMPITLQNEEELAGQ